MRSWSPWKKRIFYICWVFWQCTWGIIQNLIGVIVFILVKLKMPQIPCHRYRYALTFHWKYKASMSLGLFLFLGNSLPFLVEHEYGHTIQSTLFGPLFLLLIGIPSLLWAGLPCFRRMRLKKKIDYYAFYTERWANTLSQYCRKGTFRKAKIRL